MPRPRSTVAIALVFLLLPALAVAGPIYHATISDAYYDQQWLRDVAFTGPDGVRTFQIPGLDVISSTVVGDLGVFAFSGEIAGDALAGLVRYDGVGMERIFFRHDELPEAYPAGFRHVPSAEPEFSGWDHDGYLTGHLWAEPIGMGPLSAGSPYIRFAYTWDVAGNTISNPEPGTLLLLAGGLALLVGFKSRRGIINRQ